VAGSLLTRRSAGVLLHPTSLPGPGGVGDLGPDAHRFLGLLGELEASWWQWLPVGPVGDGGSPYQSPSSFAGSPLLVSPALLAADGLLDDVPGDGGRRVDYRAATRLRSELLARAVAAFRRKGDRARLAELRGRHAHWLADYALFVALERAHGGRPWWEWDRDVARRDPAALRAARRRLAADIEATEIVQLFVDDHLHRLRAAAAAAGIGLIGDLPIFVAGHSADVWAHPELFLLDGDGRPTVVAGVPPDYFSATGQRWGNPLYAWERHAETGYEWWADRLARTFELFDVVRIDHFRGFAAHWEVAASEETAVNGRWVEGPGAALFTALRSRLGELPVIAEDLGVITPDVTALRESFGFPGMRVAQFGFSPDSPHAPDRHPPDVVAYPGTHDNDTLVGWASDPSFAAEHAEARRVLGLDADAPPGELAGAVLRATLSSAATTVVVPFQDVLGLGSEARMNVPGTAEGDWEWRFSWDEVSPGAVARHAALVVATGRGQRSTGTRTAFPYSVHEPS